MDGLSLIDQLEKEMAKTLSGLGEKTNTGITIQDVHDWYFESEKILRIVANITLHASSKQATNQLRYAGHHLLKREISGNETEKKDNLFEAYKHCKRAYYDILDLYVLDMEYIFTTKLNILPDSEKKTKIRKKIYTFIKEIPEARFEKKTRGEYYNFIRERLTEGLRLINEVNVLIDSKTNYSQDILTSKEDLIKRNQLLEATVKNLDEKAESRLAKLLYWLGWTIPLLTALALLFQGTFTDLFRSPVVNIEHSFSQIRPTSLNTEILANTIGKK